MSVQVAEWIVRIVGVYVAIGAVVAPGLIFLVSDRFDPAVSESTRGFRLLVLPGVALLWPLQLRRAFAAERRPPIERNAHRDAAGAGPA